MKYCTHKLTAICMCRSCYIDRGHQSTESRKILPQCEYVEMNEMIMNDDVVTRVEGLFAVSRRCVRWWWTTISMTALISVGVSCITSVWSSLCSITGTCIVAWAWCCVVSRGGEWAYGWMISFALVPDVRAVAILPVGDICDDLGASVRQLNSVFTLDSVSVACLMSVVIITWGVVPYRVSKLIRLWLKHKQEV